MMPRLRNSALGKSGLGSDCAEEVRREAPQEKACLSTQRVGTRLAFVTTVTANNANNTRIVFAKGQTTS